MALDPHSEKPDLSLPEDYHHDHPDEHPTDWGWHGDWGKFSRIVGWALAVFLVLMSTSTHYNRSGTFWLYAFAAGIVVLLLWDIQHRKNSWRR